MSGELKPCPFCGGKAKELDPPISGYWMGLWRIRCTECGATINGAYRGTNREAWNRRAERTCRIIEDMCGLAHCSECGYEFDPYDCSGIPEEGVPVLADDGEPLEVGQTVWNVNNGMEFTVSRLPNPGEYQAVEVRYRNGSSTSFDPDQLTHQRPVLDADGVPIKKGDTVYLLTGEWCGEWPCLGFHGGEELEVFADGEASHVPGSVQCREKKKGFGFRGTCHPQPSQLTHTKPEIDTWQRIEEDAGCTATKYNERRRTIFTTKQQVARDLVRRCKTLAERERGER